MKRDATRFTRLSHPELSESAEGNPCPTLEVIFENPPSPPAPAPLHKFSFCDLYAALRARDGLPERAAFAGDATPGDATSRTKNAVEMGGGRKGRSINFHGALFALSRSCFPVFFLPSCLARVDALEVLPVSGEEAVKSTRDCTNSFRRVGNERGGCEVDAWHENATLRGYDAQKRYELLVARSLQMTRASHVRSVGANRRRRKRWL